MSQHVLGYHIGTVFFHLAVGEFEQHAGTNNVGIDELCRPVDRAIDMRLGGEMHNRAWLEFDKILDFEKLELKTEPVESNDAVLEPGDGETEFIRVCLTGQCKWGHHVYANSATNGPRGDALITEMIPLIDKKFRTIAKPTARFVGGHSSGGWSSLWLQVTYPEMFGGVWSTAPDPVDFRDWQCTNLYDAAGASVFFDENQNKRPLARRGETPLLWYPDFCKMDDTLGRGGQLRSFEAVFSPRGDDGLPVKCWDRETGKVDPEIAEYWKRFDISLTLEKNWMELSPKLAGKLHIYMGDLDTFYLDGATKLLGQRLKKLGSDAVVEIFPGKDHMSLMTSELRRRINREMTDQFRRYHNE